MKTQQKFINGIFLLIVICVVVASYWIISSSSQSKNKKEKFSEHIMLLWKQQNYEAIMKESKAYLMAYPTDNYVRLLRGISFLNNAELNVENHQKKDVQAIWEAIHLIRQMLILDPNSSYKMEAYYALGKAYYFLSGKQLQKAITYFTAVIKKNKYKSNAYNFLIIAYRDAKEYGKAIELLRQRIEESPSDDLYFTLIDTYLTINDIKNARRYINIMKGRGLAPQSLMSLDVKRAKMYVQLKQYQEAIDILQSVIKKDPTNIYALYNLGIIYEKQGNIAEARYQWRKVLQIAPYWTDVIEKLN